MIQRNDKLFRAIRTDNDTKDQGETSGASGTSVTHAGKENNIENDIDKQPLKKSDQEISQEIQQFKTSIKSQTVK